MEQDMSKANFQLVYEGPALLEHSMDVQELAPALLAVGNLCTEANRILNEDRTSARVSIKSDFKHGSFLVNFEVVLSFYEQLATLIREPKVVNAKELLDWLSIISTIGVAGGYGLLWYFKIRKGRKIVEYQTAEAKNVINIRFEGDNNFICVPQPVYKMGEDKRVLQACKGIVRPIQKLGIEHLKFKDEEGNETETINKDEANAIMSTTESEEIVKPQIMEARLIVHTVVFDVQQPKWRFKYGNDIISVDVSETDIPLKIIERGYVNVGDTYRVKLEIIERKTEAGKYVNDYKIVEVLHFYPGHQQQNLPLDD